MQLLRLDLQAEDIVCLRSQLLEHFQLDRSERDKMRFLLDLTCSVWLTGIRPHQRLDGTFQLSPKLCKVTTIMRVFAAVVLDNWTAS